jgi:hypothetical protein
MCVVDVIDNVILVSCANICICQFCMYICVFVYVIGLTARVTARSSTV